MIDGTDIPTGEFERINGLTREQARQRILKARDRRRAKFPMRLKQIYERRKRDIGPPVF